MTRPIVLIASLCLIVAACDSDDADTTTTTTDTTGGQDTVQAQDTGGGGGSCTPGEAKSRSLGQSCTKSCECDDSVGGAGLAFCYSGIYQAGFSFCTQSGEGDLDLNQYHSIRIVPTCYDGVDNSHSEANTRLYMPDCQSFADCQALDAAYTHCGTGDLCYASAGGTECASLQGGSNNTMATRRTCIIDARDPYVQSAGQCN